MLPGESAWRGRAHTHTRANGRDLLGLLGACVCQAFNLACEEMPTQRELRPEFPHEGIAHW